MVPSNLPMDYGAGETSSPQEEPPMPYQCKHKAELPLELGSSQYLNAKTKKHKVPNVKY